MTDEKRLELLLQRPVAHEKDQAFMKSDWPRLGLVSARESFAQGYEGIWQDGRLICTDFGFRVEDIRTDLPVQLWYGKLDMFVPPNHGVQIAARLDGRAQLRLVDETHASIVLNRMKEILEDLVGSMEISVDIA
jgi:pimeloyl-ACP methyl ester carboxylesterase